MLCLLRCDASSPYIHPVGWCQDHGRPLTAPQGEIMFLMCSVLLLWTRSSEPIVCHMQKHLERNARGRAQSSVKPGVTRLMWWWSSSLQMLVKRWTLKPLPVNYRSKKLLVWRTNSTLDDFIFTLRFHVNILYWLFIFSQRLTVKH